MMKGIVLAGGHGTRLYPSTQVVSKQLIPIYDKPIIYYPISLLMLGGVRDILIISTPRDLPAIENLLGKGERFGVNFRYQVQDQPKGIPQALSLGESFIGTDDVALVLGDNLFYGHFDVFREAFQNQMNKKKGLHARVFAYKVSDPSRYGVVAFEPKTGRVTSIEEKPKQPKSSYAIPGFYLFDSSVAKRVKQQVPSARGELEITDTIQSYLDDEQLGVEVLPRGIAWLDTGTPQSLLEATSFIATLEKRQGFKVACLEEIALRMGFIDQKKFEKIIEQTPQCSYRDYLLSILEEGK